MKQKTLLPAAQGEYRAEFDLDLLSQELIGQAPSPSFVDNIKRHGVKQPVIIIRSGKKFKLRHGRRRVMAVRLLELKTIPALVYSEDLGPAMDLSLNTQRSDNAISDYELLLQLIKDGHDERSIFELTGLSKQMQARRLKFGRLIPEMYRALKVGQIKSSVAESVSSLPQETQLRLLEPLSESGKLTAKDVAAARRVRKSKAAQDLPDSLFAVDPESHDWRSGVRGHIQQALSQSQDEGLRYTLELALEQLEPEKV